MVSLMESPTRIALTPSPAPSCCSSSLSTHVDPESNHQRPSTPKRLMKSLISGRISPFRGPSSGGGSGFLSRSGSLSSLKENRSKRNSFALGRENSAGDTVLLSPKPSIAVKAELSLPATTSLSGLSPMSPQFESKEEEMLGSPMIVIQLLSPSEAPLGITSPTEISNGTSMSSMLSMEIDEEDLSSTRSPSPFEDMTDSRATSGTAETILEDLPEGLRLMRVAQRHGIKVVDFAFEGAKREGIVEDWAWEGGAACKGFGVGFGGGAYNGVLKKYRPPPKEAPLEEPEEADRMVIDKPNSIFSSKARPAPLFSDVANGKPPPTVERPLNSPGFPRPTPGLGGSDFLKYLEERRAAQAAASAATSSLSKGGSWDNRN